MVVLPLEEMALTIASKLLNGVSIANSHLFRRRIMKLNNKVAAITGGSSGIGLATAQAFVREGAKVAIVGRDRQALDEAVRTLGEKTIAIQADVANLADLDRLYATIEQQVGNIDIVVVNAGVAPVRPLAQVDEAHYDQIMNINVKGAYFTVQKSLPILNDGAAIVLVASVASITGTAGLSVYNASKAALRSLARTFSAELIDRGIRVNAISPGPTETPIFGKMDLPPAATGSMGESILSKIPMKRLGQPEEIAKAILFLASSDSSYVLGTELFADGGMGQI
jgi:NAD(P)-dependent dehydrogenase (short-subunit alcohol dehydrogenase family)